MRNFKERLDKEHRRKTRFGVEYGLLKFETGDFTIEEIDVLAAKVLRDVDLVGYKAESGMKEITMNETSISNVSDLSQLLRQKAIAYKGEEEEESSSSWFQHYYKMLSHAFLSFSHATLLLVMVAFIAGMFCSGLLASEQRQVSYPQIMEKFRFEAAAASIEIMLNNPTGEAAASTSVAAAPNAGPHRDPRCHRLP